MWIKKLHEQGQKENKQIENTYIKRRDIARNRLWYKHKIKKSVWEKTLKERGKGKKKKKKKKKN